jgi:hypothetical protein
MVNYGESESGQTDLKLLRFLSDKKDTTQYRVKNFLSTELVDRYLYFLNHNGVYYDSNPYLQYPEHRVALRNYKILVERVALFILKLYKLDVYYVMLSLDEGFYTIHDRDKVKKLNTIRRGFFSELYKTAEAIGVPKHKVYSCVAHIYQVEINTKNLVYTGSTDNMKLLNNDYIYSKFDVKPHQNERNKVVVYLYQTCPDEFTTKMIASYYIDYKHKHVDGLFISISDYRNKKLAYLLEE